MPMSDAQQASSTRPYMIRALYEWCTDNGFTPFLAVHVDQTVQVPLEFVKDHEIVLNISFEATNGLQMGNEAIEFKGRFGGVARDIYVPVDRVLAIYARENGQGMAFPLLVDEASLPEGEPAAKTTALTTVPAAEKTKPAASPKTKGAAAKPTLTRIK
jgi:stringent starvation protein B